MGSPLNFLEVYAPLDINPHGLRAVMGVSAYFGLYEFPELNIMTWKSALFYNSIMGFRKQLYTNETFNDTFCEV